MLKICRSVLKSLQSLVKKDRWSSNCLIRLIRDDGVILCQKSTTQIFTAHGDPIVACKKFLSMLVLPSRLTITFIFFTLTFSSSDLFWTLRLSSKNWKVCSLANYFQKNSTILRFVFLWKSLTFEQILMFLTKYWIDYSVSHLEQQFVKECSEIQSANQK